MGSGPTPESIRSERDWTRTTSRWRNSSSSSRSFKGFPAGTRRCVSVWRRSRRSSRTSGRTTRLWPRTAGATPRRGARSCVRSCCRAGRQRNLDSFEAGCRIGQRLGAPLVNIVAPWPREFHGPRDYLPRYYEVSDPTPDEKFRIEIDEGFDWSETWGNFVAVVKACLERVKAHGMKLTIEHHTHTIVPDASSFLLLWNELQDPALGYNLDTGWTLLQREYPPVAIHKTSAHLMNVHVRDIDGMMRRFVHVGDGVMDFPAIAESLNRVGFSGFLSLEQDKYPGDMQETCRRYVSIMKEALGV